MPLDFETPEGSTPLGAEELEQLIPAHITTMGQLNELEQMNIAAANPWALSRRRPDGVLTTRFAKSLHKRMFGDVWKWAGKFRTQAVNIGNGRHARLMTDVLLKNMGEPPFTWGAGAGAGADLVHPGEMRASYLAALRVADKKYDYQPLLDFARS